MLDVKKEPVDSDDEEEEERYDITRVKQEVFTPPHETEEFGNGSSTTAVVCVQKDSSEVRKPLIKPPVLKLNRNVGVGVTVTVETDGREEIGKVVAGVEVSWEGVGSYLNYLF